jgi:hypothetical protein
LVLLQSPHIESSGKLEAKWAGPYLITEKTRLRSFCLADTKGTCYRIHGMPTTYDISTSSRLM